jgi:DNA mismatch repair ATPase MutS
MENLIDINNKPLVANDYFLINHFNLLLLKGPNSSGKTTFMKELALIIILAQIGSFIPCDYFCFTVRKFIYCKFDSNESIIENKGSFISQIIDIQKMIKNHSNQSLILLDEPFDNTYSIDVFSIAISFLDLFSKNFDTSFIIISSHNDIISNLSQFYFNSFIGSMIVEFEKNENINLNFLYKFKLNSFFQINNNKDDDYEQNYNNYGIILCDMIQMKKEIMDNAKQCQKNNVFEQEQIFDSSKEVNTLKIVLIKLFKYIFDIICIKETFTLEEEISIKIEKLKNFISNTFN